MADPVTATLLVASTAIGVAGSARSGRAEQSAANFDAEQIQKNAKRSYAAGTRAFAEEKRFGDLAASNARASIAAGGGDTTDVSAIRDQSVIDRESSYNALTALYDAQVQSEGQTYQAAARKQEGRNAKRAGNIKALATLISGGTDVYGAVKKPKKGSY